MAATLNDGDSARASWPVFDEANQETCILRTSSTAVSEAETTAGTASADSSPSLKRSEGRVASFDNQDLHETAALLERLCATWILFAWLGYDYLPTLEVGLQEKWASVHATIWERLCATWTLFAWLGYQSLYAVTL